jgi:hypothetical protein
MLADPIIQQIPSSIRKPLREFYEFSINSSLRKLHSQFIKPGSSGIAWRNLIKLCPNIRLHHAETQKMDQH